MDFHFCICLLKLDSQAGQTFRQKMRSLFWLYHMCIFQLLPVWKIKICPFALCTSDSTYPSGCVLAERIPREPPTSLPGGARGRSYGNVLGSAGWAEFLWNLPLPPRGGPVEVPWECGWERWVVRFLRVPPTPPPGGFWGGPMGMWVGALGVEGRGVKARRCLPDFFRCADLSPEISSARSRSRVEIPKSPMSLP